MTKGTFKLKTKRVIDIEVRTNNGAMYVRTKDVANVLGIKQPFQFNHFIRKYFLREAILSGERTAAFRDDIKDDRRTTYIEIFDMLHFLNYGEMLLKADPIAKATLIKEMEMLYRAY